jgi:hypothetical protein
VSLAKPSSTIQAVSVSGAATTVCLWFANTYFFGPQGNPIPAEIGALIAFIASSLVGYFKREYVLEEQFKSKFGIGDEDGNS